MNSDFLPLGTVVLLENGQKKLMITGYCIETPETPGKIYDYCGVIFPEGTVRSDIICVFDKSQIKNIYFTGYNNEESREFLESLKHPSEEDNEEEDFNNTIGDAYDDNQVDEENEDVEEDSDDYDDENEEDEDDSEEEGSTLTEEELASI